MFIRLKKPMLLVSVSVVIFSCAIVDMKWNSVKKADNVVVAHRGAWKHQKLPQNSIAALRAAIDEQFAGSEFDVRMTADDVLVVTHDPDYYSLPIGESTYAELSVFPLSNGEKLPTLREYILAGTEENQSTKLFCEIKPFAENLQRNLQMADQVLELVDDIKASEYMVYISFNYEILKYIESIDSTARTQYLGGDRTPLQLKEDKIDGADYHYSILRKHPEWIEQARQNNLNLNTWTVNAPHNIQWFLSRGFKYITTDNPRLVRRLNN